MSCGGQRKLNRKLTIDSSFERSEERIDGLLDQIDISCEILCSATRLKFMLASKQDGPARTHCNEFFQWQDGFRSIGRPSFTRIRLAADRARVRYWLRPHDRDVRATHPGRRHEKIGAGQQSFADLQPGTIGEI